MSKPGLSPNADVGQIGNEEIVAALASGACATVLRAYFGPKEYNELSQLAQRVLKLKTRKRGRVYLLPGIMGSSLGRSIRGSTHTIWLNPDAIAAGELLSMALPDDTSMQPLAVLLPGYLKLQLLLMLAGFDVVFHPFDWRKSIAASARDLMRRIETERAKSIALVGHSMGGLVVRAALALDRKRIIKTAVQIGAPNAGSFAPVMALRAVYGSVRKIATLDPAHTAEQLSRHVFRSLPGIYELLPQTTNLGPDLFDLGNWPQDLLGPDATMLKAARGVRERLPRGDRRCFHIVGIHRETVTGATKSRGGFEYRYTYDGDGTVPAVSAEWPGARHFFVEELHGMLTQNAVVAAAVADLLTTGNTRRLRSTAPKLEQKLVRSARDSLLRKQLRSKVRWDALPMEERRRILDPIISPEFIALASRKTRAR